MACAELHPISHQGNFQPNIRKESSGSTDPAALPLARDRKLRIAAGLLHRLRAFPNGRKGARVQLNLRSARGGNRLNRCEARARAIGCRISGSVLYVFYSPDQTTAWVGHAIEGNMNA